MEEEEPPLPPSDLGGVPWKEAVRIHALLKGRSEEELEASRSFAAGEEDAEDAGDEEDEEDEEDASSEGQSKASSPDPTRVWEASVAGLTWHASHRPQGAHEGLSG